MNRSRWLAGFCILLLVPPIVVVGAQTGRNQTVPKIRVAADQRGFEAGRAQPFVPFGVNYFRPGSGWAPQLWKRFDLAATRRDMERMKELGVNCVRVFLTYGSFYAKPGVLAPEGLAKFDQFLNLAEDAGIYVHPTGPDHWEGVPDWAKGDRLADEAILTALESFWQLLASRYRGRNVIFAYDLLNEPSVQWDSPAMRAKWKLWLEKQYDSPKKLTAAWQRPGKPLDFGAVEIPPAKEAMGDAALLDYQHFREGIADEWTRRQARAIKSADPEALVTVGLIQWSVPALLPSVRQYSAFRPQRQAEFLDFLEIHFYPLARGAYEYRTDEDELRNTAYLQSVVREVARAGKPVVVAEFGWYGGGKPTFDNGKHPPATEEQQARWCQQVVQTTAGLAAGWLDWGFYDHPEARDVTQLTGLLTADGQLKAWGREFRALSASLPDRVGRHVRSDSGPALDWDSCITSPKAAERFREEYFRAYRGD